MARGRPSAAALVHQARGRASVRDRCQAPAAARRARAGRDPVADEARRVRPRGVVAAIRGPEPQADPRSAATSRCGGRICCRASATTSSARSRLMLVEDLRARARRPRARHPTQRKALMLLQGILRRAVVRGLIPANPVSAVDKPKRQPRYPSRGPSRCSARRADRLEPRSAPLRQPAMPVTDDQRPRLTRACGRRSDRAARWHDLTDRALHVARVQDRARARRSNCSHRSRKTSPSGGSPRGRPPAGALIFPTDDGDEWKLPRLAELAPARLPALRLWGQG